MARVSVVMPVYNGETYLELAIRSVLNQTVSDLELIIVDDGSNDGSAAILDRLAAEDGRIRIDQHSTNQGHHVASNRALDLATGEFIARHDQDDILMADWLSHAVCFLGTRDDIGVLGGAYRPMVDDRIGSLRTPPAGHEAIRASLMFKNVFSHPGIVVRSSLRESGELEYRDFGGPQDYDLWVRLLDVTRGANLAQQAVLYRRHSATMSASFDSEMPSEVERISNRQLQTLLGPDAPDLDGLRAMRRLWRAQDLRENDFSHLDRMGLAFDGLATNPLIDESELVRVRHDWARRLLSRSLRTHRKVPWRLVGANKAASAKWVIADLPRGLVRHAPGQGFG